MSAASKLCYPFRLHFHQTRSSISMPHFALFPPQLHQDFHFSIFCLLGKKKNAFVSCIFSFLFQYSFISCITGEKQFKMQAGLALHWFLHAWIPFIMVQSYNTFSKKKKKKGVSFSYHGILLTLAAKVQTSLLALQSTNHYVSNRCVSWPITSLLSKSVSHCTSIIHTQSKAPSGAACFSVINPLEILQKWIIEKGNSPTKTKVQ